ncbi:hypothetical protein FHR92_000281 [Fontibacillus solani]|uniref:TOTE conflict system primase domain-containing protein n=1 Tax=Fontibacillus solani TaxID=1572857 RepID=A0A7W3XPU8_9BACL|nr:hypothetical protein [Fontibacillus solani]MBA9083838.1 hypothetical protein [Fontibacillus solani]
MDNMEDKYNAALAHIEKLDPGILDDDNTTSTNEQIMSYSTSPATESKETTVRETNIHRYSTVEDKLALYKSYFRGREDVYPIRWSNKQGKSGFSPACANEWTSVCEKPRVKCSFCKHQSFVPLTNVVLSAQMELCKSHEQKISDRHGIL